MPKKASANLFQYVFMAAFALFRWGAQRLWNILTFWKNERKKPLPDRQKIDRAKAFAGLLAILAAVGFVAWFFLQAMVVPTIAFLDRQTALYIGAALLIVGLQMIRLMPQRKKIGLALAAAGALLMAYGLGYLG